MGAINVKKVYCALPPDIRAKLVNSAGKSNGQFMSRFFEEYMESGNKMSFPIINRFENDDNLVFFNFYLSNLDFEQITALAAKNLRSYRSQVRHFAIYVYSKL